MNPQYIMYGLVFLIGVIIYVVIKKLFIKPKTKKMKKAYKERRYARAYHFFNKFFLTSSYIRSLNKRLADLSIYSKTELQIKTISLFRIGVIINLGTVFIGLFGFKDIIVTLICVFFGVVLSRNLISKQIEKQMNKTVNSFAHALSVIRQEYLNTNSIVEAIELADIPSDVQKPFGEILNILTSNDPEEALRAFRSSTPFRTIQTFASICHKINTEGDEISSDGNSNFSQAITMLMADVNGEIEKEMHRKQVFGIIEWLPVIPIISIIPIQTFFESQIPGTALVYNSAYGYLIRIGTLVLSILAYVIVTSFNTPATLKTDDRSILIYRLLQNRIFKKFAISVSPKNRRKRKIANKLKTGLSRMTVEELYIRKVVFAIVLFSFALISTIVTTEISREYATTSTKQMAIMSIPSAEEYKEEDIIAMDKRYLAQPGMYSTDEQMATLVKSVMRKASDMQVGDEITRLKAKKEAIEDAYFKWYYIPLSFFVGFIGWLLPSMLLGVRRKLVQTEQEEDFLQLQTLTSILMYTNIDTLDLLGELGDNSTIHKDMFIYAYHSYSANPELEITRMQSKVTSPDFKRFLGSMKLSISELSLREAYSDLVTEREHIKKIQSMKIEKAIQARRTLCSPVVFIPLLLLVIGVFALPIGILGITEMLKMQSQMK